MTITLYGSYYPKSELAFLKRQKEYLISQGYVKTQLVMDYNPNGLNSLDVSKRCLQFSDVNFLIFTQNGKRHGVIRELAFVAESRKMITKVQDCVVFDQVSKDRSAIPPLSLGDIENSGILKHEFTNEQKLQKSLSAKSFWYLRKKKKDLESRPNS